MPKLTLVLLVLFINILNAGYYNINVERPTGNYAQDTKNVQKALKKASDYRDKNPYYPNGSSNTILVIFQQGTYKLNPMNNSEVIHPYTGQPIEEDKAHLILNSHHKDVTLMGAKQNGENKTTIIFKDINHNGMYISNSTDCVIQNLTLKYSKNEYSQGTITSTNYSNKTIDFSLDHGFLAPTDKIFKKIRGKSYYGSIVAKDKSFYPLSVILGKNDNDNSSTNVWNARYIGNNTYRINVKSFDQKLFKKNHKLYLISRFYGRASILAKRNKGLALISIDVLSGAPGLTVILSNNEAGSRLPMIYISKLRMYVTGSRILSSGGDAIHSQGNKTKVIITNSNFSGMADDAINLYNLGSIIYKEDLNTPNNANYRLFKMLHTTRLSYTNYKVGDSIYLTKGAGREHLCENMKFIGWEDSSKTDPSFSTMRTSKGNCTSRYKKYTQWNHYLYNKGNETNARNLIYNNHFGNMRGHSVVLTSPHVDVTNNTFVNSSSRFIIVHRGHQYAGEGPVPYDINIHNNTFYNPALDYNKWSDIKQNGGITIAATDNNGRHSKVNNIIKDISIKNNLFSNIHSDAIFMSNCENCEIGKNSFLQQSNATKYSNLSTINVRYSKGIKLNQSESNAAIINNQSSKIKAYVRIIYDKYGKPTSTLPNGSALTPENNSIHANIYNSSNAPYIKVWKHNER